MTVSLDPLVPTPTTPHTEVFVFPHAGGSPRFFGPLARALPDGHAVHGFTYPGRDALLHCPPATGLVELARECALAVARTAAPRGRTILFGHSMGSYVAFETAVLLETSGSVPDLLVVSGADAPSIGAPGELHRATDRDLIAHLGGLDARTRVALTHPALARLLLPTLRADYRLVETYRAEDGRRVRCRVAVVRGLRDPELSAEGAAAWAAHTHARPLMYTHPGDHLGFLTEPHLSVYRRALTVPSPHHDRAR